MLRAFGGVDILVNNAGILRLGKVVDIPETYWDDVLRSNLKSVFLSSRAVARQMIDQERGGRIIDVSSIHARLSEPNAGAYAASKGGIDAFTRTLASELAPCGINANCVAPRAVLTKPGGAQFGPEDVPPGMLLRILLRQAAKPEWIAPAILFLASDSARYMTGSTLTIDGGYLMDGSQVDLDSPLPRELPPRRGL